MSVDYRAKISVENRKVIFEINDDLEVYNVDEYAKKSVESWFHAHKEDLDLSGDVVFKIFGNESNFKLN